MITMENREQTIKNIIAKAEEESQNLFRQVEDIALYNQEKVLDAFRKEEIAERHLKGSSGYGYGDIGKEALCRLYADIFHTESAIVSPLIANGTHALTIALFGLLRTGDTLYSITGSPYDTLRGVIGGTGGSLREYGIKYKETDLIDGEFDFEAISKVLTSDPTIKVIFITRSRGYSIRDALSPYKIGNACEFVKSISPSVVVFVDNCYGEFTQKTEPTDFGVDVVAGSLIKNIGGGIAPTGGYIAGKSNLIEDCANRLTAPGLGNEVGSYITGYSAYFEGLFIAPAVVKNAIKGGILVSNALNDIGFRTTPTPDKTCNDIIRSIQFNTKEELISFIQMIQVYSPIDSNVLPVPWAMPGYDDEVIMAAGTFVAGASIELSADAPIKEPYIAYFQGGITYEHVKIALKGILGKLLK